MTRTLVLTVDRDNDLGIKTAIRGPVVGRRQVLTAALKLGIADPEESDTNAILGALSQHDNLSESLGDDDEVIDDDKDTNKPTSIPLKLKDDLKSYA